MWPFKKKIEQTEEHVPPITSDLRQVVVDAITNSKALKRKFEQQQKTQAKKLEQEAIHIQQLEEFKQNISLYIHRFTEKLINDWVSYNPPTSNDDILIDPTISSIGVPNRCRDNFLVEISKVYATLDISIRKPLIDGDYLFTNVRSLTNAIEKRLLTVPEENNEPVLHQQGIYR